MDESLQREEQAIRASERQLRRFEWYTAGSVYFIIVFFAFMGLFSGAVRLPAHGELLALVAAALGLHVVATVWLTHSLIFRGRAVGGRRLGRSRLGRGWWIGYAALTVATMVVGALSVRDLPAPGGALPVPTWVSFNALLVVGLVVRARVWTGIGLLAGALVTTTALLFGVSMPSAVVVGVAATALGWGGAACGLCTAWTLDVVRQLHDSRVAQARLAVAEERLRFGRDLHDVTGRALSAIGVKSQLAAELARRGDPRAVEQMLAVHSLADEALADMRGLVRGYRTVDPTTELAGARSLLRSAGVTLRSDDLEPLVARLGQPATAALGWFIREGTTNVLRHSDSREVTLRTTAPDRTASDTVAGEVVVVLANDRPHAARGEAEERRGHGLTGLAERIEAVGGRLSAGPEDGRFVVRAHLPTVEPSTLEEHQ
ncbi:two-component system sensor histidine kinase DesK [Kineosphaera limosa]|uniref:Putative two-component histidine kinase n=1 Tax=Kineosphaera limosa NBRC 100340 TaxID=1184609 RepID=K6WQE0_9MICO|nr:histidine kinase [Kineosphaera limosa]NYE02427.1 two-component system sensor histidine kinase DesK [Kineosphaera limosa]GAB96046.1 putative two-component histidine kinase [Kineosphaera limosa NBRC 100340]